MAQLIDTTNVDFSCLEIIKEDMSKLVTQNPT